MAPLMSEEEAALDPYALLGIEPAATEKEVKKAYRLKSLKYHPDKNATPEGAIMFRQISLSLEILIDAAKRSFLDNRLDSERRRKEQYAASNKKRKDMIDALNAREEDAKKAKVEQAKRRQQAAEEEAIKDAGKRMLEEAQRRALATQKQATPTPSSISTSTIGHRTRHLPTRNGYSRKESVQPPAITAEDLRLFLHFPASSTSPASSSSATLQSTLENRYGPINLVVLKDPPPEKKKKGRKAIVEFGPGNWGGCWACWRDHDEDARGEGKGRGLEEGLRAKWAAGRVPAWVDWAARQNQENSHDRTLSLNGADGLTAPSFGSAPDFVGTTMADLLAQHSREKEGKAEARRRDDEFESMTLLRMRRMERDSLAEQIRREEEGEGMTQQ